MRVGVFVGTRADLGPLDSVIAALSHAPDIDLEVLCGIAFEAAELSRHLEELGHVGAVRELASPIDAVTPESMVRQGTRLTEGARVVFEATQYDSVIVLGDRWELLYVVPAALLYGVRIVHIHGGEVTEGALDERVRHAVTKLADVHCVASADAAKRVRQLGEPAERIHITGAPGLDRFVAVSRYSDEELAGIFGREIRRPLGLFTYHPPTAAGAVPLREWVAQAVSASLQRFNTLIITDPGVDAGREIILDVIDTLSESDDRIIRVRALGRIYPRVLASVDAVIGNSSSGVIEAASVRVPAVDIGSRQEGRLRASSVLHAEDSVDSIVEAIDAAFELNVESEVTNPYGNGDAAEKIVDAVRSVVDLARTKAFQDLEAGGEW